MRRKLPLKRVGVNKPFFSLPPLEGELLVDFADRLLNDPVKIDAEPSRRERKKINQWYYHADSNEHKIKLLARFIETENVSRGIVFVRVVKMCESFLKPCVNVAFALLI